MTPEVFKEAPPLDPSDRLLIELYKNTGRTLDDLPYTCEFDDLYDRRPPDLKGKSKSDVFRRLLSLRKAGRLPRLGLFGTSPIPASDEELQYLAELIERNAGTLGQRDRLPYSPEFKKLAEDFNKFRQHDPLDDHAIWRLIARIAK